MTKGAGGRSAGMSVLKHLPGDCVTVVKITRDWTFGVDSNTAVWIHPLTRHHSALLEMEEVSVHMEES